MAQKPYQAAWYQENKQRISQAKKWEKKNGLNNLFYSFANPCGMPCFECIHPDCILPTGPTGKDK